MDWAKAKTILIAVFLAINVFLGYIIIGTNVGNIGYVDSEKVKKITDYLAEKNIMVKGQVPLKKTEMPLITVKYKFFSKDDIVARFFMPDKKAVESVQGNTVTLKGDNLEISIKDSRELQYLDNSIKPAAAIDEKTCSKNIEMLLNKLGLKVNTSIIRVEELDGYRKFTYEQTFKGAPVFNSVMEFYVNDSGIHKARIVWFDTLKQVGRKDSVISPEIALLYLPEHYKEIAAAGVSVLDIKQGYYFGIGASGQVDTSQVEEGTAFPVWKITTDRDIIYINAHNEKVEGVEKARK